MFEALWAIKFLFQLVNNIIMGAKAAIGYM